MTTALDAITRLVAFARRVLEAAAALDEPGEDRQIAALSARLAELERRRPSPHSAP